MKIEPIEDIEVRYDTDLLRARMECAMAINEGLNRKWLWTMQENKNGSSK